MGKGRGLDKVIPPALSSFIGVFFLVSFLPVFSDFPPFPLPLGPAAPERRGRGGHTSFLALCCEELLPVRVTQLLLLPLN